MKAKMNMVMKQGLRTLVSMILVLLMIVASMSVGFAVSYHTIRVNYYYADGVTHAHDPYIATFNDGEAVDLTIKNPNVSGFDPVRLYETSIENDPDAVAQVLTDTEHANANYYTAATIDVDFVAIDQDVTYNVYYVAGMSHYAARYYLQNIYDDLYTLDRERTNANTDRLGLTGTAPSDLESEKIPGFTSLFHEPDAIAADGSTVFRVYYDRNFYSITYDLGEGGYGVDPIYAKYGTEYRIDTPKRDGYTFLGWARTSADSAEGEEGTDWVYLDPDAVVDDDGVYYRNAADFANGVSCTLADVTLTEEDATAPANLIQFEGAQYIPAMYTHYKAVWESGTTSYSVVYWLENEDSDLADDYFENLDYTDMTQDQLKAIVAPHYSVIVAHDVTGVESGTPVTLNTPVTRAADDGEFPLKDFFRFNLNKQAVVNDIPKTDSSGYPLDNDGKKIDFLTMSDAIRDEFTPELQRYYELNTALSSFQFRNGPVTVAGDGTTRINVFYKRKTFTLQFFYAKTTGGTVTYDSDGTPHWDKGSDGVIYLTNGTKNYSNKTSTTSSIYSRLKDIFSAGNRVASFPQIVNHTDIISANYINDGNNSNPKIWYYEVKAKFGASLLGKWFNDAFDRPLRADAAGDDNERAYFGSWAVEIGSDYYDFEDDTTSRGNWTIKGLYEKLYDEILLKDSYITGKLKGNPNFDYTELHFAASWDNTGTSKNGDTWNDGVKRVFNFTYKNCVELLPSEEFIASTPNGIDILINGGTHPAGDHEELNENGEIETVHYEARTIAGRYTDIVEMDVGGVTKLFGLTDANTIETYDAGDQYTNKAGTALVSANTMGTNVRKNQTAVTLTGFSPYASNSSDIKTTFTVKSIENGEVVTTSVNTSYGSKNYGNGNAQATFYAANGFDQNHHADVYFFYTRNSYTLKYRNSNHLEDDNVFKAYYQAPLFLEKFQHTPVYYNPDLVDYYNFEGWYYDPFYVKAVDFANDRMPDEDVTLYAKWSPKTIKVIFYDDYDKYYEDRKLNHPEKRVVLNQKEIAEAEEGVTVEPVTLLSIDYGNYIPLKNIPVDDDNPNNPRPRLDSITKNASFAGWYYMRNRTPQRFEPENVPVTTLNEESGGDEPVLRLYAEWVTTSVAKYQVKYVRDDDPTVEVADPTTGRAYVWKTKTFNAKSGDQLYDDYKWSSVGEDEGTNWWPTTNSTSLVVKANETESGYEPNTREFRYIQKAKVYYKVQYLNMKNFQPLDPEHPYEIKWSTHGSVKEDAKIFNGYIAQSSSETLVLTASTDPDADAQIEEELRENVITFLYNENDKEYLYEVEYMTQDVEGGMHFTNYLTETLTVPIASQGDTTISILNDVVPRQVVTNLEASGFERTVDCAEYFVTDENGDTDLDHPVPVVDNTDIVITGADKKTIRIYFTRKEYHYIYQYIDHTAEKTYLEYLEAHKNDPDPTSGAPWNGVITVVDDPANVGLAGAEVDIPAPYRVTHSPTDYVRVANSDGSITDIKLTIQPDDDNAGYNVVKVYYRLDTEREISYKMICVNENGETDYYDDGTPMFGRLSFNLQTVNAYDAINPVTFYSTDGETTTVGSHEEDLHDHGYTFLGWYTSDEYDPENPAAHRLTDSTDPTLNKEDMNLGDALPDRDVTYYALVKQNMVKIDTMFYYIDDMSVAEIKAIPDNADDALADRIQTAIDNENNAAVTDKVYPAGERAGMEVEFTSPTGHQNHVDLPFHKSAGYSMYMSPIDDRVYKYEFAEWWAISANNSLIRKTNWSTSLEYSADALDSQLARNRDQYLIAVYARRDVTSMPYVIEYKFLDRFGEEQTFVKKGTLTADQLDESSEDCAITSDGDFRLTDEFILENAPYESNYGQTLLWSNRAGAITKSSQKEGTVLEDETTVSADRVIATITAVQDTRTVYAHYRTTPDGEYHEIETTYGANHKIDENMKAIEAPESYNGMAFSYWAVRKSNSESATVVAKSYDTLFDLCMMDNYWITPVYEGAASGPGTKTAVLDPNGYQANNEDWLAWTWNTGEQGVWVRCDSNMTFTGLKDYVIFARVPAGTAYSAIDWDSHANLWNWTEDLTVQDGATYQVTGYGQLYVGDPAILGQWIDTPDPGETPAEPTPGAASVTLTHLDYTRNRWTDADGNIAASGETDLLFSDFEIAYEDNGENIYNSDDYKTGVVLEYCATVPDNVTFNPTKDYKQTTDYDNLTTAVSNHLAGQNVTQYSYKTGKNRSIVFCDIPTTDLTNHNRVEFSRFIFNSYTNTGTEENPVYTHNKCNYLIKVTAYLVDKDGNVTFSKQPVYMCYKTIASQDDALSVMIENVNN